MQRVAKEQFHDDLARLELSREAAEPGFVVVGWRAEGKLGAKFLSETAFQSNDCLIADLFLLWKETVSQPEFVLRAAAAFRQQPALLVSRRPATSRRASQSLSSHAG